MDSWLYMTILKPFNAGTKQISVVILQLIIKNYLTDWLLSNMKITRVSLLLQAKTLAVVDTFSRQTW